MTCIHCFTSYEAEPILSKWQSDMMVPYCERCEGVLKPDVILFGEQLPAQVMIQVERALRQCDLLIVAGSSLEVFPAADIPRRIKHSGGKLIIINLQPTDFDSIADVVIHENLTDVLPQVVSHIKGNVNDE